MSDILSRLQGLDLSYQDALLKNLQNLLATRLGSFLACPDYGLPDLLGLDVSQAVDRHQLLHGVQNLVQVFEPRIKNLKVLVDESALPERLLIRIQALDHRGQHFNLSAYLNQNQLFNLSLCA